MVERVKNRNEIASQEGTAVPSGPLLSLPIHVAQWPQRENEDEENEEVSRWSVLAHTWLTVKAKAPTGGVLDALHQQP